MAEIMHYSGVPLYYSPNVLTINSTNKPEDCRPIIRRKGSLSTKRPKVQVTTNGFKMITFNLDLEGIEWVPPVKEVCLIYPSDDDIYNSVGERFTIHECKYHWVVVAWQ